MNEFLAALKAARVPETMRLRIRANVCGIYPILSNAAGRLIGPDAAIANTFVHDVPDAGFLLDDVHWRKARLRGIAAHE